MASKKKDPKKRIPNCGECVKKKVALIPENYMVYSIIEEFGFTFMDGMGSLNIQSIKEAVNLYDFSEDEKIKMIKLILAFYKTGRITSTENKK